MRYEVRLTELIRPRMRLRLGLWQGRRLVLWNLRDRKGRSASTPPERVVGHLLFKLPPLELILPQPLGSLLLLFHLDLLLPLVEVVLILLLS